MREPQGTQSGFKAVPWIGELDSVNLAEEQSKQSLAFWIEILDIPYPRHTLNLIDKTLANVHAVRSRKSLL